MFYHFKCSRCILFSLIAALSVFTVDVGKAMGQVSSTSFNSTDGTAGINLTDMGIVTRDELNQKDWLDFDQALGMSVDQVVLEFGSGGLFEGFRLSTVAEFVGLMESAGIQLGVVNFTGNYDPAVRLSELLGVPGGVDINGNGNGLLFGSNSDLWNVSVSTDLCYSQLSITASFSFANAFPCGNHRPTSWIDPNHGHWLVRDVPGSNDTDDDGVPNADDNCPNVSNSNQSDLDGDGQGDVCDACPADNPDDSDADGVCDSTDVCPGFDDNVDTDDDGVADGCDLCPNDNPDDTDGDEVCDSDDVCHGFNDNVDTDEDGASDGCDMCEGFDDNIDTDEDGVPDGCDKCEGFDDHLDVNEDGVPDGCETSDPPAPSVSSNADIDSDGVTNAFDDCPGTTVDSVVDEFGCACDQLDADGDNVDDCIDRCTVTVTDEDVNSVGCSCDQIDCDDNNSCTDDSCIAGICSNDTIICDDDGDFCNGEESCEDGSCISSGNPCVDNTLCNEEADSCDVITPIIDVPIDVPAEQPIPEGSLCGATGNGCGVSGVTNLITMIGMILMRFVGPGRKRFGR